MTLADAVRGSGAYFCQLLRGGRILIEEEEAFDCFLHSEFRLPLILYNCYSFQLPGSQRLGTKPLCGPSFQRNGHYRLSESRYFGSEAATSAQRCRTLTMLPISSHAGAIRKEIAVTRTVELCSTECLLERDCEAESAL